MSPPSKWAAAISSECSQRLAPWRTGQDRGNTKCRGSARAGSAPRGKRHLTIVSHPFPPRLRTFAAESSFARVFQAAPAQPCGFSTRCVEAGYFASLSTGRRGRATSSPPQFGHLPFSTVVTHDAQNVHSNEQMSASLDSGGRSLSQHSQFGRNCNIAVLLNQGLLRGARGFPLATRSCCCSTPAPRVHRAAA